MALKDRWVQAEVNELLERRLSPNPLVTIHKYPHTYWLWPCMVVQS
jgi:carboxymethylenebutenolidase